MPMESVLWQAVPKGGNVVIQIQKTRDEDSNVPVRPEGYKQVTEGKVLKSECETRCENIDRTCNPKESHLL
jgi:hypothetical protein